VVGGYHHDKFQKSAIDDLIYKVMGIYATAGDFGVRLTEKGDNCLLLEFQRWLDEWKSKTTDRASITNCPDKISKNDGVDAFDFDSLLAHG
jgi:hypothetical protein